MISNFFIYSGASSGAAYKGNANFTAVDKAYPAGGMVKPGTHQTVTYTAVMAGPTEAKTVTFTGGTASTTIKIATGAPARAFLDNIVITIN